MNTDSTYASSGMRKKRIITIALVTACILLVPLVAMQFTTEVQWTLFDFIFMGALIFGTGLTYEFVASRGGTTAYRSAVALALLGAFLLVWINGAVGIIGNEDNPANLMYGGVLLVGLVGGIVSRLEARGMARTLFAAAFVQALVPVIALIIWRPDFGPGVVQVLALNALFVMLFVVSGLLFRHSLK